MQRRRLNDVRSVHPIKVVCYHAFLIGIGIFASLATVIVNIVALGIKQGGRHWFSICILGVIFLSYLISIRMLVLYEHECRSISRAILVGGSYGLGIAFFPGIAAVYMYPLLGLIGVAAFTLMVGFLAMMITRTVRQFGWQSIVQDGTLCPYCGYSLIGQRDIESSGCPECGERFTFAEMGTSEADFVTVQRDHGISSCGKMVPDSRTPLDP